MRTIAVEGRHAWAGFSRGRHDLFYRVYVLGWITVLVYDDSLSKKLKQLTAALKGLPQ